MSLPPLPPLHEPVWVDTPPKLAAMVDDLLLQSIIAVDTESNSLYAYTEQVCLIQFSTHTTDYLVDPLSLADLSALAPVFANPGIEKVFHAVEYDLICLKRDFGFEFNTIFDTMLGGRTLGWRKIGLGSLLEEHFSVAVNKRFQRADWGKRPLKPEELDYARTDTHYLIPLRNLVYDALVEAGRWDLAKENFRQMTLMEIPEPPDPLMNAWQACMQRGFTPRQSTVLYAVCKLREEFAQRMNRPSFKVFSKEILVALAQHMPKTLEELRAVTPLSQRQFDRFGHQLLAAVKRGMKAPLMPSPRRAKPYDEMYHNNLDALRTWRKHQAKLMDVESDVILTRDIMENIAEQNPKNLQDLQPLMDIVPERYQQFGPDILNALDNHTG
ncbi:MAG: HRDC domain-containing protein [Anaerolineae bacterium]|nr:HRDC domain-containing protein [Anaerolineae bacterium]